MYFFISSLIFWLIHSFFSKMLFNFHVSEGFPNFFLWFISRFIMLWSENMHGMISIFFYLLRDDLWPNMWSILENIPCALEKNMYSATLGWNVVCVCVCVCVCIKSTWSSVSFRAIVSLLIFYVDDLSIAISGVFFNMKFIVKLVSI